MKVTSEKGVSSFNDTSYRILEISGISKMTLATYWTSMSAFSDLGIFISENGRRLLDDTGKP